MNDDPVDASASSASPHPAQEQAGSVLNALGEDIAAAEFVATEEALGLLESLGGLALDLARIGAGQWAAALEDAWQTSTDLLDVRSVGGLVAVQRSAMQRRCGHLRDGMQQSADAVRTRLSGTMGGERGAWSVLGELVRNDWRRTTDPQ